MYFRLNNNDELYRIRIMNRGYGKLKYFNELKRRLINGLNNSNQQSNGRRN